MLNQNFRPLQLFRPEDAKAYCGHCVHDCVYAKEHTRRQKQNKITIINQLTINSVCQPYAHLPKVVMVYLSDSGHIKLG